MNHSYCQNNKGSVLIYDNIVSKKIQDTLIGSMIDQYFPWHTTVKHGTVDDEDYDLYKDDNTFEYMQFAHTFIVDGKQTSAYIDLINLLVLEIQKKLKKHFTFSRIKANLQTKVESGGKLYNTPHKDTIEYGHTVMLYYVNDSDTPTYIFKNTQAPWEIEHTIEAKKGRVVIFDGSKFHAGAHPKTGYRAVINFNLTSIKDA